MLWYFSAFVLFLKSAHGGSLNNTLDHFPINFANKIDAVIENRKHVLSTECRNHLLHYAQGLKLKEEWALKMFDAGASLPPSGILEGNLFDLGSFDECLNVEKSNSEVEIFGKYCLGNTTVSANSKEILNHNSPLLSSIQDGGSTAAYKIYIAKCFPDTCSTAEMQNVYGEIDFELTFSEEYCQTKASQPKLTIGSYVTLYIFGTILCINIISTALDVVLYYLQKKPHHQILISFSAFTNFRKLIQTSSTSNDISCLHGIRVISIMWIIFIHSYEIGELFFPVRNSFYRYNMINDEKNMFIISLGLAVDTFFLMSGSLIIYNYMNATNNGAKFSIFLHYLHRYVRLAPVLAIVVVFHITLLIHTGSGPLWPSVIQTQLVDDCEIHWWKTLLYVQNISKREQPLCVPQSWYLGADMQLYIVSPFLILPLKRYPKLTLSVIGSLTVLSTIVCFLTGWFLELNIYFKQNMTFEKQQDYFWYYYFPMYTRAGPWLIGMILGYAIFQTKKGHLNYTRNKVVNLVLWAASFVILCTCGFAGHDLIVGEYNKLASSFHLALVRPVWAVAVAWIIFACANGCGGPVNWFLSLPVFQVVSKLTYSFYVVHYTIIYITMAQMRSTTIFNISQVMFEFWGVFACTFVVSVVLVLTVELPVLTIYICLFGRSEKKEN